jgi:hypothetical protein
MMRGTPLAAEQLHTGQTHASSRWQPQRLPPATILTESSGNWGHPDTLTDGTQALGGDKRRVYT